MDDRCPVEAFDRLVTKAVEEYGGHLTIFRFTTGWKVMLGTVDLDTGVMWDQESGELMDGGRKEVGDLPGFESLSQALHWATTQWEYHVAKGALVAIDQEEGV